MNKTRIVVVGAGIVGASIAYHLSGKGAQVTLIEAGEIANGVTAIVGRLASQELLDQQSSAALEPCRPERFLQT